MPSDHEIEMRMFWLSVFLQGNFFLWQNIFLPMGVLKLPLELDHLLSIGLEAYQYLDLKCPLYWLDSKSHIYTIWKVRIFFILWLYIIIIVISIMDTRTRVQ